jgi:hypothetical protein
MKILEFVQKIEEIYHPRKMTILPKEIAGLCFNVFK